MIQNFFIILHQLIHSIIFEVGATLKNLQSNYEYFQGKERIINKDEEQDDGLRRKEV